MCQQQACPHGHQRQATHVQVLEQLPLVKLPTFMAPPVLDTNSEALARLTGQICSACRCWSSCSR